MTCPEGKDDFPEVIDHLSEVIDHFPELIDSLAGREQAGAEIRDLHALID
jgi:hypothetical protein